MKLSVHTQPLEASIWTPFRSATFIIKLICCFYVSVVIKTTVTETKTRPRLSGINTTTALH